MRLWPCRELHRPVGRVAHLASKQYARGRELVEGAGARIVRDMLGTCGKRHPGTSEAVGLIYTYTSSSDQYGVR